MTFKPKVDVKDYKANVHTSLDVVHAAMNDPDPTYYANRRVIESFVRFSRVCSQRFGKYVKYWLNFNEIDSLIRHSFTTAGIIPELCGELACCYQAAHNQFMAGVMATKLMRELIPGAQMGLMLTKLTTYPHTSAPEDVAATQKKNLGNLFYADVQVFWEYLRMILCDLEKRDLRRRWNLVIWS